MNTRRLSSQHILRALRQHPTWERLNQLVDPDDCITLPGAIRANTGERVGAVQVALICVADGMLILPDREHFQVSFHPSEGAGMSFSECDPESAWVLPHSSTWDALFQKFQRAAEASYDAQVQVGEAQKALLAAAGLRDDLAEDQTFSLPAAEHSPDRPVDRAHLLPHYADLRTSLSKTPTPQGLRDFARGYPALNLDTEAVALSGPFGSRFLGITIVPVQEGLVVLPEGDVEADPSGLFWVYQIADARLIPRPPDWTALSHRFIALYNDHETIRQRLDDEFSTSTDRIISVLGLEELWDAPPNNVVAFPPHG